MKLALSHNYVRRRALDLTGLILLAFALDVAAAVGLSYVAGFSVVRQALGRFQPIWLLGIAAGLLLSFVGYYYAYRATYRAESGPSVSAHQMRAVVIAGFGGFFAHGGVAMDEYALQGAGATERGAKVRAGALGGLEHGVLGLIGSAAGLAALALDRPGPPLDFQVPWAVIPVPAMLLAFFFAGRHREQLRDRPGLPGKLGVFLDVVGVIRTMFHEPRALAGGPVGMGIFWVAELGAGWAALAAFGFRMNGASYVLGYLTGAVFTRRTGPFAGAGVLMLCLPVTIWYSGAPFGSAIAAIFVVRFVSFWLPLPFSLASLPALRSLGAEQPHGKRAAESAKGEPAIEPGKDDQPQRAS